MGLRLRRECLFLSTFLVFVLFSSKVIITVKANIVFKVQHRYSAERRGLEKSNTTLLAALKAHDVRRHGRLLSSSAVVDLPLGGDGSPTGSALYYTKIGIGNPPLDYYVQVDTGSDILWVNCAGCDSCPKKSDLGIKLRLYDPTTSTTASLITCDQEFCTETDNYADCKKTGSACPYNVKYGDGSSSSGYFVKDNIQLDRASGNLQTSSMNGTIAFGCGDTQSGQLGQSVQAVDGILGFGQANTSMLSQLATAGKVKKSFSHCLDGNKGGGIFAIGQVVEPKSNSTPLIPNQPHYNINLKSIEVGGDVLQFSSDVLDSDSGKSTIVDSGTTLAYLEDDLYNPIIGQIMAAQTSLRYFSEQQFTCFQFRDNVDEGFPTVTFHFENSLSLVVYPHDYLFPLNKDQWCIGWQNGGLQSKNGEDLTLLGDMVLSDKVVFYDLEDMTIGWTNYDCSSSIKVRDEETGSEYLVGYSDISSDSTTDLRSIWWRTLNSIFAIAYLANYLY